MVLLAFFAVWLALVVGHRHVPWPLLLIGFIYLGGLWLSLQHELLHGHPTKWNAANTAIGFVPLAFWLPFTRYKASHIQHHRADLTDPLDDPETTYVPPSVWQAAPPWKRRYLLFLRTTPGRFTLGVPRVVARYWWRDLRHIGDPHVRRQWITHLAACVPLAWWMFGVVEVNVWVYLFGFVLGGVSISVLRSFVEHCATPAGTRSAVVKAGPVISLLLMNINLHHTHHAAPDVPWYGIPAVHREIGADEIAAAGAGLYPSYFDVLRRYFFTPFCQPDHPLSPGARPYGSRGLA